MNFYRIIKYEILKEEHIRNVNINNSYMLIKYNSKKITYTDFYLHSENHLPIEDVTELKNSFSTVKHLTIAKMNYNWSDIQQCISMFPSIEELSVSFNIVTTIEEPITNTNIMKIVTLILEGNSISSWDEILKLASLPW